MSNGPQVMPQTIRLHGLIPFEIQNGLQELVARRVTVENCDKVSPGGLNQRWIIGVGVLDNLADHNHRHLVRGKFCCNPVGQCFVDVLVMQNTRVQEAAHQRLI